MGPVNKGRQARPLRGMSRNTGSMLFHIRGRWNPIIATAALALLCACGSAPVAEESPFPTRSPSNLPPPTSSPSPPATTSPAASPTASRALRFITDKTYGYTFGYPAEWTDVTSKEPIGAGIHVVSSRPQLLNPVEGLQSSDWFLVVTAQGPTAVGCGEPYGIQPTPMSLDGQPANLFLRIGDQTQLGTVVVDVIAKYNGTCYDIQLMCGSAVGQSQALATVQLICSAFRFKQ